MKNLSRKALSVVLAVLMAVPMIMFTPLCDNLAVSASAESTDAITVTADGAKVAVPETVYLSPVDGTMTEFQYYINNTIDADGNIGLEKSATNTTGYLYFYCPKYSESVTATVSSGTATIATKKYTISVSDGLGSVTIPADDLALSAGLTAGNSGTVKWTFSYTLNGTPKTITEYTTVYAPLTGANSTVAAETAARNKQSSSSKCVQTNATVWIAGVNKIQTATYSQTAQSATGSMKNPPLTDSDVFSFSIGRNVSVATGTDLKYNSGTGYSGYCVALSPSSGSAASASHIGYYDGLVYFDSSRTTNLSQIPNLQVGIDAHLLYTSGYVTLGFWKTDGEASLTNIKSDTTEINIDNSSDTGGTRYGGYSLNYDVSDNVIIAVGGHAYAKADWNYVIDSYIYTYLTCKAVSKSSLRTAVMNAQNLTKCASLTDYESVYSNACYILGKPDATADEVTNATTALTAFASSGKATLKCVSTGGKELYSESKTYNYGDTVSYTPKTIDAYTTDSSASSSVATTSSMTFNATYTPLTYTASFNANGGSCDTTSIGFTVEKSFTLPTPSKAGSTFAGWKITSGSGNSWTAGNTYEAGKTFSNVYGSVAFEAQWTENTYTIGYDNLYIFEGFTGGTSDMTEKSVSVTFTATSSAVEDTYLSNNFIDVEPDTEYIVSADYEISGSAATNAQLYCFFYEDDGEGCSVGHTDAAPYMVKNIDGEDVSERCTPCFTTGNHYYVVKTPSDCYKIKFRVDCNNTSTTESGTVKVSNIHFIDKTKARMGAIYSKSEQSIKYGNSYTLITPTTTGYTFSKWVDADGNTVSSGKWSYEDNKVLYSVWNPITYKVLYSANGGTGSVETVTSSYDTTYTVADASGISKTGYTFAGWYMNSNCTGDAVTEYTNLSSTQDEEITLYAKWNANSSVVNFDSVAIGAASSVTTVFDSDVYKTIASYVPTKAGYVFGGYYTSDDIQVYDKDGNAVVGNYWKNKNSTTVWCYDGTPLQLYAKWTPITYTVKYDLDYEDCVNPSNQTGLIYDEQGTVTTENPTRTGYEFAGWYFGDTLIGEKGATFNNLTDEVDGSVTLTAHWTAGTYTVKYDANGGTGSVSDAPATYDTASGVASSEGISKTGYLFAGWYLNSACTGDEVTSVYNLTSTVGGEVTLYAKWDAVTYTVKYNVNGGDGSVSDVTATYDKADSVASAEGISKTGYTFAGWYLNSGCTGDAVTAYNNLASTQGAEITLFAKWTPITYSVCYNPNGGNGSSVSEDATYDVTYSVKTIDIYKTGYYFDGWYRNSECTGDKVTEYKNLASSSIVVTLFAKWTPITYTITYNANGGTGELPEDVTVEYDEQYTIPAISLTRGADTFAGWSVDGGENSYSEGAKLSNLTTTDKATVTLTARWVSAPYTVTYKANNGTEDYYETVEAASEPFNVIDNTFVYNGYNFAGWVSDVEGDETVYTSSGDKFVYPYVEAGTPVTFTAQWTAVKYNVYFSSNGGEVSKTSSSYYVNTSAELPVPTKEGYTFAGWEVTTAAGNWTKGETFTGTSVPEGRYGSPRLTAQWTENSYKIKYSNGSEYTSAAYEYKYTDLFTALANTCFDGSEYGKTGYTFTRWSYVNDKSETVCINAGSSDNSKLTSENNKEIVLTPDWTAVEYTAKFDANGGSLVGSSSAKYDITGTFTFISATKTGCKFDGWKVKTATGSWNDTEKVYNAAEISAIGNYGDVTFVAQWSEITYKVVYNAGEGTGNDITYTYNYSEKFSTIENPFTADDLDFAGWKDGKSNVYSVGQQVSKLADTQDSVVTFTAVWRNHDYISTVTKKVSCTEDGKAIEKCIYCGKEVEVTLKATGHKYIDEVIEPTCISEGYTSHICAVCGDSYVSDIVTTSGHHWIEKTVIRQATCTVSSIIEYECRDCHETKTETSGTPSHSYTDWTVIQEPTCAEYGIQTRTCEKCGNIETAYIAKTEHHITEYGKDASGSKIGYCDVCGQTITYGSDGTEEGTTTGVCSLCGREHKNFISSIVCFFVQIGNFFKNLF